MWLNLAMSYSLDYLAGLAQGRLCRKETGREYRHFTGLQLWPSLLSVKAIQLATVLGTRFALALM